MERAGAGRQSSLPARCAHRFPSAASVSPSRFRSDGAVPDGFNVHGIVTQQTQIRHKSLLGWLHVELDQSRLSHDDHSGSRAGSR